MNGVRLGAPVTTRYESEIKNHKEVCDSTQFPKSYVSHSPKYCILRRVTQKLRKVHFEKCVLKIFPAGSIPHMLCFPDLRLVVSVLSVQRGKYTKTSISYMGPGPRAPCRVCVFP